MNERIEKLFEQALEEFKAENKYATIIVPNPLKEKFAELIVKECVQFIDEENVRLCEYQISLPEWDGNKRDDCDLVIEKCVDLADKIKEHFGVEE